MFYQAHELQSYLINNENSKYFRGICPRKHQSERGAVKRGSHYERMGKALVEAEDKITAGLGEELQETMKQYINLQGETDLIERTDSFIYGYRLGVLMTMEVFKSNENAIYGGGE